MYKALIHSVPGTGTRFAVEFVRYGLEYVVVNTPPELLGSPVNRTLYQTHVGMNINRMLRDKDVRMVTPLRDPYMAFITRWYHFHPIIETKTQEEKEESFAAYWRGLIKDVEMAESPIYLPVDSDLDHRWILQYVAEGLDARIRNMEFFNKMVDGWPKVGTVRVLPERDEYEATGQIEGETPTFLDFAVEWYRSRIQSLKALQ